MRLSNPPAWDSPRASRPGARDFLLARFLCQEWARDGGRRSLLSLAAVYWADFTEAGRRDLRFFILDPLRNAEGLSRDQLIRYGEELIEHWRRERLPRKPS